MPRKYWKSALKMLISLESKLAILATPKTGSTSIEAAMVPFCDIQFIKNPTVKHMTLRRFHRHIAPYLAAIGHEDIETTALIRDPIDWLGSWYRYRRRDALRGHANSTLDVSFDAFAQAYMSDPKPPFARVGQQSLFLQPTGSGQSLTHLFKYENMDDFRAFLENRFGESLNFPDLNSAPKFDLDLRRSTKDALRDYFARDYELWNAASQRH